MTVAEQIRSARIAKGYSIRKMARLVGVSRPSIHNWESGEFHPRPHSARRLEALLGVEIPPSPHKPGGWA